MSGESVDGTDLIGGIEWAPDHPCFNGHMRVEEPLMTCDRCGAELERHPNGRWSVHTATDHEGGGQP